ncbi:hypothetical protein, partial [Leptospira sp. Pond_2020]|uniref:hypothetical protein n=1 Tax=Leptospira sp. Pond_2020 TaxID=2846916 RepID=UPI001E45A724
CVEFNFDSKVFFNLWGWVMLSEDSFRIKTEGLNETFKVIKDQFEYKDTNFSTIYETSRLVSYLSEIPIYEKAPLIGEDVISHTRMNF